MWIRLKDHFVWRIVLVLCLAVIGQAQTKCSDQKVKEKKDDQTVIEKNGSLSDENTNNKCDFSSFDPIKQMPGGVTELPKPAYPPEAKEKKIIGLVSLRVLVDRLGQIVRVCKLKGEEILAESAIRAAEQIKIDPKYVQQRLEGKKQNYLEFTITYNFSK